MFWAFTNKRWTDGFASGSGDLPQSAQNIPWQAGNNLTAKEYEILALLVANKGRVLTYDQIYQKVWGEEGFGSENNTVGCQVRNLREKLYEAEPDAPFSIRCVREVGYCFEINSEEKDAT